MSKEKKEFLPDEDEMNSITISDIDFTVEPTVEIFRHKSNGQLSVSIDLEAEPDDEDEESFTLSVQDLPTNQTDVKALEGKCFTYDERSSLAGFVECDDESQPNEKDIIEFLKVTDDKVFIKWSFKCAPELPEPFEYVLYEVIFEADYVIEDTDEEYPMVYSEYVPAEGETNYMIVDGIRFDIDPENNTLEFVRYKDSPLLTMNLYINPETTHNHVTIDKEDNAFCMSTEAARIGVSDIKDLKGKTFDNSELDGSVYCVEHGSNEDETLEILDVTDTKVFFHWSGKCWIGWGGLGCDIPFDSFFEAEYEIIDEDEPYPYQ